MKILLTNDDGIHAPGIEALFHALVDAAGDLGGPIGEVVWPVAPLEVQSAMSHGITFHTPLMTAQEVISPTMSGVSVDGRPADCVKLAINSLWPEKFGKGTRPDLVISGMNAGANVGINVIYSGTVAAAIEAAFLGVPSIAMSLRIGRGKTRFDVAAKWARKAIDRIIAAGVGSGGMLGPHSCVSVNMPTCDESGSGEMPPMVVCPMNTHALNDSFERRVSPSGDVYYWATGHGLDFRGSDAGTDVDEMMKGRIAVTPLWYDLTNHAQLSGWKKALKG
ncbi:MAG TPA: 5'/3'-nucleotidase SurE [Phycisphaerales bacterium]|nr:5'/3'-nucleotidase SurE [Phycisphaerales bacterium]